jgi:hypothetical protein
VGDGPCENDEDLPPGWTKQFDQASQRSYYINQLLAKSQWNKPTANAADSTTAIPPPAGIVEGIAWRQFKRAQRNAGSVEQSRGGSGMGKLDVDDQVEVLKDGKDWRPAKIFRSLGNGLYAVKYEDKEPPPDTDSVSKADLFSGLESLDFGGGISAGTADDDGNSWMSEKKTKGQYDDVVHANLLRPQVSPTQLDELQTDVPYAGSKGTVPYFVNKNSIVNKNSKTTTGQKTGGGSGAGFGSKPGMLAAMELGDLDGSYVVSKAPPGHEREMDTRLSVKSSICTWEIDRDRQIVLSRSPDNKFWINAGSPHAAELVGATAQKLSWRFLNGMHYDWSRSAHDINNDFVAVGNGYCSNSGFPGEAISDRQAGKGDAMECMKACSDLSACFGFAHNPNGAQLEGQFTCWIYGAPDMLPGFARFLQGTILPSESAFVGDNQEPAATCYLHRKANVR